MVPGPVMDTPSDPADARNPAACAAGTAVAQVRLRVDHALLLSLSALAPTRRASVEAESDFLSVHATVGSCACAKLVCDCMFAAGSLG